MRCCSSLITKKRLYFILGFVLFGSVLLAVVPAFAQDMTDAEYRPFPLIGSRNAAWIAAQLHLLFGSFILGVPMFAVIIEFIGWKTKEERYDRMAQEFIKLCMGAFSTTALLGGVLVFILVWCYPKVLSKLSGIFGPTMIFYVVLFFGETFTLYIYSYGWDKMKGRFKWVHLVLGVLLNVWGTAIMFVSNTWLTYQTSPATMFGKLSDKTKEAWIENSIAQNPELTRAELLEGVTDKTVIPLHNETTGEFWGTVWEAVNNFTWMPVNIHRLIGNIAFGGSIVAAYAAFRYLVAKTKEEKAHYDWMGYNGNFIALCGLIPLPFAGYWLGREIYMFNNTMGINMMGSLFSWLFIIQAVMIGVLFIGANYYLWSGMGRIQGAEIYARYRPYMIAIIVIGVAIWMTPRTLSKISTASELSAMGGSNHPHLGLFGLMTSKNTVVNIVILTTFLSFLFYRRSGKTPTVSWKGIGNIVITAIFFLGVVSIVVIGIVGFIVPTDTRVNVLTPWQVLVALGVMVVVTVVDIFLYRKATTSGTINWGQMTERSQYVLILLAITFTSLMGLMGYARSGLREGWHIFGVQKDTSVDAFTPALGDAVNMVSIIMVIFFALVGFIFWLGLWGDKKKQPATPIEAEATVESGD
ncbi:MAG: cytochrome ubiquinol oxidase subunit I [Candidatus Poribacteria bacterium]|nr:cytochrome ubiquinol oxidase subunit I [Candidatus Poribacteria bacterium]